jgi:hypothetical protein
MHARRQRTYGGRIRAAFESAGLRLVSITTTHSPVCLIEASGGLRRLARRQLYELIGEFVHVGHELGIGERAFLF